MDHLSISNLHMVMGSVIIKRAYAYSNFHSFRTFKYKKTTTASGTGWRIQQLYSESADLANLFF